MKTLAILFLALSSSAYAMPEAAAREGTYSQPSEAIDRSATDGAVQPGKPTSVDAPGGSESTPIVVQGAAILGVGATDPMLDRSSEPDFLQLAR